MSNTYSKSKLSILRLVFPPMSNQEANWFKEDPAVADRLKNSDFYMIGGRPEIKFWGLEFDDRAQILRFGVSMGKDLLDSVSIDLQKLPGFLRSAPNELWLEAGEKFVRTWNGPVREPDSQVVDWFTTEKLLWARSHNTPGITGLDRFIEFLKFDLLYVGIAKVGDSFERLINNGHQARMEILSNEPQRSPGARVTDEIYLFLFTVDPLVVTTFEPDHTFEEESAFTGPDKKRIVSDAEKAFVSMLRPEYNVTQFSKYPEGKDGVHDSDLDRYAYLIGEDLEFSTAHGRVRGRYDPHGLPSNDADFIFISGKEVSLLRSGVDFSTT